MVGKPIAIHDAFWEIPALNGFPGGYMNDIAKWFTSEDFINLMTNKTDRRICLTECIVYQDSKTTKTFTTQYWGEIAYHPSGTGNSIDNVAIFNGKTLGDHYQIGDLVFDPKDYVWNDFAKWFSDYSQ